MTTVSPAQTSLPAQPASAGSAAGPKPDHADTFSSTLDREMANRSPRRAPNAGTRPAHRADPHAAHRPAALRGRAATASVAAGDAPRGDAAAAAADGTTQAAAVPADATAATAAPGTEAPGTVAPGTDAPGTDAMLAAAVALAQQQVEAQPTDPRVALAVPGSPAALENKTDSSDAGPGSVDGSAPKPVAAGASVAGRAEPSGIDAAGLGATRQQPAADAGPSAGQVGGSPPGTASTGSPMTGPATGGPATGGPAAAGSATAGSATGGPATGGPATAGSVAAGFPTDPTPAVPLLTASPAGPDSPATATSIADALAADAAATSAPGTTTGTTTPGGAGPGADTGSGNDSSASSTGQQPGSDPAGLPSPVAGPSGPDPTRSDPASAAAVVTPGTITAAQAGKVAETASIAATEALLNAAGAGAPLTMPDVTRASTDGISARTAAALPSHVTELARLAHISSDGTARLTVRLDPPELGAVTLHMTSRGSDVELSLRAETPAGAAALAGQQARVRDLLADHGFDLSHFTIAGVTSGDDAGFADPRQRDQGGTSAGDPGSGESRFSTDPDRNDRGSARSGFAGGDGFGNGGRPGSRTDDGWSENGSPARRSTAATTATEGTWL